MKKHTQGPWEVDESGDIGMSIAIINSKKDDICFCEPFYGEEEANARLIASAPELLEMCKNWRFHIEANGKEKDMIEYYKPLVQIIAKAEGEKR